MFLDLGILNLPLSLYIFLYITAISLKGPLVIVSLWVRIELLSTFELLLRSCLVMLNFLYFGAFVVMYYFPASIQVEGCFSSLLFFDVFLHFSIFFGF